MKLSILNGNTLELLPTLPAESIDLCITSPPYWGLRAYGTSQQVFGGKADCQHEWEETVFANQGGQASDTASKGSTQRGSDAHFKTINGKCLKCGAWRGEYGNEPSMEQYLDNTMRWVKEVWRVLKPTGSFVLNIGDCFIGGGRGSAETRAADGTRALGKGQAPPPDWKTLKGAGTRDWKANSTPTSVNPELGGIYKTKQLLSVSSFAYCRIVSETDFVCRGEHIWAKPNVPSPIRSRLKHSHEKLFWFVKDADKYYFDAKPWMKKLTTPGPQVQNGRVPAAGIETCQVSGSSCFRRSNDEQIRYMREKAKGKAKLETSEEFRQKQEGTAFPTGSFHKYADETIEHSWRIVPVGAKQSGFELSGKKASEHVAPFPENLIKPYVQSLCPHDGIVLDPFLGSGTTMRVAMEEHRSAIGIELSGKYAEYAKKRLNWNAGLGIEYEERVKA